MSRYTLLVETISRLRVYAAKIVERGDWKPEDAVLDDAVNNFTAIVTELLALRSSPAVDGVGVNDISIRPLEWVGYRDGEYVSFEATTILGRYQVWQIKPTLTAMWQHPFTTSDVAGESIDACKIAAQAHFDAAIRSALSPTSDRASVVAACAKVITDLADEWKRRGGLPSSDGEWPAYMAKAVRRLALSKEGEAS